MLSALLISIFICGAILFGEIRAAKDAASAVGEMRTGGGMRARSGFDAFSSADTTNSRN
jgi:hypothetical protein